MRSGKGPDATFCRSRNLLPAQNSAHGLPMNPTNVLKRLLGVACAGSIVIPLLAQVSSISSQPSAAPGGRRPADPEYCATGTGGALVEGPLASIHAHVSGFHFYNGDLKRGLRAEHYCSHLNKDVFQCVIYESDKKDARLIGIEYIISEALFNRLPAEEKKLWHSHRYEVMSGQLVAPELSPAAEKELMQAFVSTYGKTWYLWQVDRGDTLPLGLPKLMMGFTADGQADPAMVAARDREAGINAAQVKARRANLPVRPVAAGADGWQQGQAFQLGDDLLPPPPAAPKR